MKSLLLKYLGKKFIAGETPKSAWSAFFDLKCTYGIDHVASMLCEGSEDPTIVKKYIELVKYGDISVKPSSISYNDLFYLCTKASITNSNVCLDMEDSSMKEYTFWTYRNLTKKYTNVSMAIQVYLKESFLDITNLLYKVKNPKIRLVKGAYFKTEKKRGLTYTSKSEVEKEFLKLAELILLNGRLVCGTHNIDTIQGVMNIVDKLGLPKTVVEYQFIYGLSKKLWYDMAKDGYRVRIYMPIGDYIDGAKYLLRRLNWSNFKMLLNGNIL